MNPGGGSGWDEPPLDIQIPDDARELDRDVLAYHRELRAQRRRNRLRRLAGPFAAHGTVMPLLASILAVCLVAGAMLSVATFSPATAPAEQTARPATAAPAARPASPRPSAPVSASAATSPAGTTSPVEYEPRGYDEAVKYEPVRHQPGRSLGQPVGLVRPARPVRRRLIWSPALTPGGGTATISPSDGSESRRPLR